MSISSTLLRPRPAFVAMAALFALAAHAQPAAPVPIDIPAQPLDKALGALARQSGARIMFSTELTESSGAPAVRGTLTVDEALARLLAGSGLVAQPIGQGGHVVVRRPAAARSTPAPGQTLSAVTVTAPFDGDTTENTGSYTSGSTSASTGLNLSLRETPQSVTVMTRQRMQDQNLTQLTDVAAQTPGLTVNQSGNVGSDSAQIYSRGFAVNNYMIDGVKLLNSYDSIYQSQDMALYDRVEIVRGATGLMNGSGTPGAGINLVRKRPTRDFQASARLDLGSWDYRRADVDISTPLNATGSVRGRLVAAVQDAGSYIDRLKEDRRVLYGVVEADLSSGTVARAGISQQRHDSTGHARGGLPAYYNDGTRTSWARSASAAPEWAYSRRHSTSAFATLEHFFDNGWEVRANVSRTLTDSDELVGYASRGNPDRLTGTGVGIWATHWRYKPRQDVVDLAAKGQFTFLERKHDVAIGTTLARSTEGNSPNYTNWTFPGWNSAISNIYAWDGRNPGPPPNPEVGFRTSDDRNYGAYASARLRPTDRLSVVLGARVTDWSRTTSSTRYTTGAVTRTLEQERGEVVPYAGVVFDLTDNWSAYASHTTIFQPQTAKTREGDFLAPLSGVSRELGLKGAFLGNRLNAGVAVYEAKEDNKAVALTDVFAPDGSQAYEARSGTKSRGVEFDIAGRIASGWELAASFSRNITRDRLGAPLNTAVPQNTAKLYTTYRVGALEGLVIGGGLRWQNQIYTDGLGPARARFTQPSYAVVDLMARYAFTPKLIGSIHLNNLLDKVYYTTTGNSYYGAPRSLRVALEARF